MNLHEYQSKEILAKYGVNIQRGFVANNVDEAVAAAEKLTAETGAQGWVVKLRSTLVVVVKVAVLSSLQTWINLKKMPATSSECSW
jgi:succinyl-CoA synthetase beta subunit